MIHPRAYGLTEGRSYNTCLEHLSPWLLVPISLLSGPVCVQPSQSFSNNSLFFWEANLNLFIGRFLAFCIVIRIVAFRGFLLPGLGILVETGLILASFQYQDTNYRTALPPASTISQRTFIAAGSFMLPFASRMV
jgi:hypothetical protein